MNKCPNCGFDVPATSTDNFCPNCGVRLPWTIAQASGATSTPPPGAGTSQPGGSGASPYGGQASSAYDPSAPTGNPGAYGQFTAGASGARRSTAYAAPDATQQGLPSYLGNVSAGNLPAARQQQQNLPPVAPAGSADPTTNMLLGILRAAIPTSSRGLIRLAIAIVVIVVAFIVVAKVVSVLLSWLPWIVLAAIIIYLWQRQRMRRRGRLP